LADSTKFGHQSLALMCKLEDIDKLVVDSDIPHDWRSTLLEANVDLMVASPTSNTEMQDN
jgi:DeoR/GlpR family transcriptional regulator of sugar metabolism